LAKRLQNASDHSERTKLSDEMTSLQKAMTKELLALAQKNSGEADSLTILKKLTADGTLPDIQKEAAEQMIANHVKRSGIGEDAPIIAAADPELGLKFARAIAAQNPNDSDKALALLTIGYTLKRQAIAASSDEAKRSELVAQARTALEKVKGKYPNVKVGDGSILQFVDTQLAGLKNVGQLIPGKPVPEIEGEDLDGKEFKLSDYRGKVILLDFWAHW
jgi:hypothetical protein